MESAEILALIGQGYMRQKDIARMIGVTKQRAAQIVRRDDFPPAAKTVRSRRLWRREDVETWVDARPVAWHPAT